MKNILTLILMSLIIYSCSNSVDQENNFPVGKSPEVVGRQVMNEFLSRNEFMLYQTETVKSIHYAEACAAFGALRLAGLIGDTAVINEIFKRYRNVAESGPVNTKNHVDVNVYGILPLELYIQTGDSSYFREGIELADMQWENPLPNGMTNQTRYWIDDIWMIGSLQVQAYRATGEMKYLERAALEIDNYLEKLQQPDGLFFHGEISHFYWGRGNGWVAAGIAEILSELPASNPHCRSILAGYKKMMYALKKYQAEDGMWRQLVDVDSAWKETSCTAMFGYAVATGVEKGLLDRSEFGQVYQKAWTALCDYVTPAGKLRDVCAGTGQADDLNFYLNRPKIEGDLHGQAPLLWFAYRLAKMNRN